ncbi:MAG TPA: hypothetical protein VFK59_05995 [Actinomycetota bacterium]|jgi:hypothetical protein|nr:hypothetical protein [Actinomycetota bacterium]
MANRKWLAAGIVAGSVGIGALVGGAAFAPGLGFAQTDEGTDSGSSEEILEGGWCFGEGEGPIAVAAEAIGIPPGDLLYAMRDGSTIAEVAESEGVGVQTVIAAIVASMQDRLDAAVEEGFVSQELADELAGGLEDRATSIVNGEFPFHGGGPMGGPFGGHGSGGHGWGEEGSETDATNVGLF